jgi:hypothetical protein
MIILQEMRLFKLINSTEKNELYVVHFFRPIIMITNVLSNNTLTVKICL